MFNSAFIAFNSKTLKNKQKKNCKLYCDMENISLHGVFLSHTHTHAAAAALVSSVSPWCHLHHNLSLFIAFNDSPSPFINSLLIPSDVAWIIFQLQQIKEKEKSIANTSPRVCVCVHVVIYQHQHLNLTAHIRWIPTQICGWLRLFSKHR